ncbi:ATP-dependent DNA helicase [Metapseudomonas resinovorans]|uniref:ATP-dependent DNA helicase n=1 Tax=Metapseudomonas resinovorans TaxID=53412 RepID=UPI00040C6EA4|nr:AAA family ATPase [Pseudomonas resinovorans]
MNAPTPVLLSLSVRVTRIRTANRKGCIAFGHRVNVESGLNDRASAIVIHVPANIASPSTVAVGGIFEVCGEASTARREHGGYAVTETQLHVQDIRQVRPSGSQVIQWMADNVPRIREVKATKLWDALGERLYEVLDQADHDAIREIVPSDEIRQGLFACWAENGDARTLRFVQDKGIPLDLARKAIKFHQRRTVDALLSDPYRLLSFSGSWRQVDAIARERFAIELEDPRRLAAALEEALYRVSERGHTCATLNDLHETVSKLLKPHAAPSSAMVKALMQGKEKGQFIARETATGDLMLHAPGTYIMERQCADFIRSLLVNPVRQQRLFPTDVDAVIAAFEQAERQHLGTPAFALNDAQRAAVKTSFEHRFSIITGGAGVGKTTVLKALYKALDTLGRPRFQMALSGRATARMVEATHEEATTIAGFLRHASEDEIGESPVIVIDEASMLDLVTFYRLVQKLPLGAHFILVGDPYQLPPIGAGLVLHVLCELEGIPTTRLTEVKRQARDSGIPAAALAIRQGAWPAFSSSETADVAFLSCSDEQIIPTVLRLYEQSRENTQILCATRVCAFAGIDAINNICHAKYVGDAKPLKAINPETGELEFTGFCEGDLLLYTANDWGRNLQNGCLGRLTEVFDNPVKVDVGTEEKPVYRQALGMAIYEGVAQYVLESDVDVMQHAYAITVHKSQGSQFPRVIVLVRKSRVLDRTFIYTAVTRAQVQVILVGDAAAVREAIAFPPKAFARQVALHSMLEGT